MHGSRMPYPFLGRPLGVICVILVDTSNFIAGESWWRHQMETFSALLAICAGNSLVTGEFPAQSPVTRSFDIFTDLRLNKRLRKQSWGWWFETLSRSLWRQRNVFCNHHVMCHCMRAICTLIARFVISYRLTLANLSLIKKLMGYWALKISWVWFIYWHICEYV